MLLIQHKRTSRVNDYLKLGDLVVFKFNRLPYLCINTSLGNTASSESLNNISNSRTFTKVVYAINTKYNKVDSIQDHKCTYSNCKVQV